MTKYIKIIVEGPPKNVLVETDEGQAIEFGSWSYSEENSVWELRIPVDEHAYNRHLIKDELKRLTPAHHDRFKQMYAEPQDPRKRTPDVTQKIRDTPINAVVDQMPDNALNWALQQVTRSLEKQA